MTLHQCEVNELTVSNVVKAFGGTQTPSNIGFKSPNINPFGIEYWSFILYFYQKCTMGGRENQKYTISYQLA